MTLAMRLFEQFSKHCDACAIKNMTLKRVKFFDVLFMLCHLIIQDKSFKLPIISKASLSCYLLKANNFEFKILV